MPWDVRCAIANDRTARAWDLNRLSSISLTSPKRQISTEFHLTSRRNENRQRGGGKNLDFVNLSHPSSNSLELKRGPATISIACRISVEVEEVKHPKTSSRNSWS